LSLGDEVWAIARNDDFLNTKNAQFGSEKEMAKAEGQSGR
jgi:hypothetical protein